MRAPSCHPDRPWTRTQRGFHKSQCHTQAASACKGRDPSAPPKGPCSTPLVPGSPRSARPPGQAQGSRDRPGLGTAPQGHLGHQRGAGAARPARPYARSPQASPGRLHTPHRTAAPGRGCGSVRPGTEPRTGTEAPKPRPGTGQQRLTMWQETPPALTSASTIWQGPCGPLQSLCLSLPRRDRPGGLGRPSRPSRTHPVRGCPLRAPGLTTTRAGRPARPPFHGSPSLPRRALAPPPSAAAPPRHWLPARRCCRAIGCGSLSIKAVLRHFRTKLAQRKNRTQAGRAKRVNKEKCTMRGQRRGEPWAVSGQITGIETRTAAPITITTS